MRDQDSQSIASLAEAVIAFRDERDWKQFHNPKDVAISLTLEAAELLEIFQWEASSAAPDFIEKHRGTIENEIADVLYWVLLLASDLKIDLAQALAAKLDINGQKYPVQLSLGRSTKYDELRDGYSGS